MEAHIGGLADQLVSFENFFDEFITELQQCRESLAKEDRDLALAKWQIPLALSDCRRGSGNIDDAESPDVAERVSVHGTRVQRAYSRDSKYLLLP